MTRRLLIVGLLSVVMGVSQAAQYAILYNHQDATAIAANVSATMASDYDAYLTTQERTFCKQVFQRAWNGGLNGWSTSPRLHDVRYDLWLIYGDNDMGVLLIVVSGQQVSLADLRSALAILGQRVPNAEYMGAIARDLAGDSSHIDPYPPQ